VAYTGATHSFVARIGMFDGTQTQVSSGTTTISWAGAAPPAPSNLTATAISSSQIRLNWTDTANETSYVIQRWNGSSFPDYATTAKNSRSWTDSGLAANSGYFYQVCAVNAVGRNCAGWVTATTLQGSALNVPLFSQNDRLWRSVALGSCGTTIGAAGCTVTAKAMLFKYYGITVSSSVGSGMDPKILNGWLVDYGGYSEGCLMSWGVAEPAGIRYTGSDTSWAHVTGELSAGRPVLAQVHSTKTTMHFVVITGQQGGTWYINDPWNGSKTTFSKGALGAYVLDTFRYFSR
jgi:hypothetical protein